MAEQQPESKPVEVPVFKPVEIPITKPVEQAPPAEEEKVPEVPLIAEKPAEKEETKKEDAKAPSLFGAGTLFTAPPATAGGLFGAPNTQSLFGTSEKPSGLFGAP